MDARYEKLLACLACVREKTDFVPDVALILGSGLGALADEVQPVAVVNYADIAGFPISTVVGHAGRFVFGHLGGVKVVIMQGRVHFYEGYDMADVVLPTRLMGLLGAKVLFLTNAAGGINTGFAAGDLMAITDQITAFVPNPLLGPNLDELGPRFPDMSQIYDPALTRCIAAEAEALGLDLKTGVYAQFTGPSFETPAEIRMLRTLGADAVGMSTACEAVAARHMGLRVCGVSCISNLAAGVSPAPLSHEEVFETANSTGPLFRALITGSIRRISEVLA